MANLFKISARGKWIAAVHAVERTGVIGSTFPDGQTLVPDREAIRAAIPHQWRKAFDNALLGQLSNTGCELTDNAVHYRLFTTRGVPMVVIYCTPYEFNPNAE